MVQVNMVTHVVLEVQQKIHRGSSSSEVTKEQKRIKKEETP